MRPGDAGPAAWPAEGKRAFKTFMSDILVQRAGPDGRALRGCLSVYPMKMPRKTHDSASTYSTKREPGSKENRMEGAIKVLSVVYFHLLAPTLGVSATAPLLGHDVFALDGNTNPTHATAKRVTNSRCSTPPPPLPKARGGLKHHIVLLSPARHLPWVPEASGRASEAGNSLDEQRFTHPKHRGTAERERAEHGAGATLEVGRVYNKFIKP